MTSYEDFDVTFPTRLRDNPEWPMKSRQQYLPPHVDEAEFEGLEKEIIFTPGHALRNLRGEGPSNSYGIASMEMSFVLKGEKGAATFVISLGWVPELVKNEYGLQDIRYTEPMAFDLGYHAEKPQGEWQTQYRREDCLLTRSGTCYYDGSGLQADALFKQFVMTGSADTVWIALLHRYQELF